MAKKTRVGVVGFGSLGQYLAETILTDANVAARLELAFVWNRTADKISAVVPPALILHDLAAVAERGADVIVEVAHPDVCKQHGARFVQTAHFMIGSPTALADADFEQELRRIVAEPSARFGLYVPSGALWGAQDIQKMGDRGTVTALTVTMKKAPHHLKLEPPLAAKVAEADLHPDRETIIFEERRSQGPVRELCPLAPNNVNTMAAAALAAHNLGFDRVRARLVADPRLERHVVEVDLAGPNGFRVVTERSNPAAKGHVTGQATYVSFLSSLLAAGDRGAGVHFC